MFIAITLQKECIPIVVKCITNRGSFSLLQSLATWQHRTRRRLSYRKVRSFPFSTLSFHFISPISTYQRRSPICQLQDEAESKHLCLLVARSLLLGRVIKGTSRKRCQGGKINPGRLPRSSLSHYLLGTAAPLGATLQSSRLLRL